MDAAIEKNPREHTDTRPRGGVSRATEARNGLDRRRRETVMLGKRWSEVVRAVKMGEYTWAEFVEGLSEEELSRGQLKDVNGKFQGRPPSLVPREFLLACQREMKRRFEALFSDQVIAITKQYLEMARTGDDVKPETRAKMLQYAMERVFGGIPKDVRVSQEAPWEQMMVNVVRSEEDPGLPDHTKERYARYLERQGGGIEDEE